MVSPVWSSHTATVGHTCALAKQWRQTVRIETIAGQRSTRERPVAHGVGSARPKIDSATERKVRKRLAKGVGILKVAKFARARDWHGAAIARELAKGR